MRKTEPLDWFATQNVSAALCRLCESPSLTSAATSSTTGRSIFVILSFRSTPANADEFSALTYLRRDKSGFAPMLVVKASDEENEGINESIDRFLRVARRAAVRF